VIVETRPITVVPRWTWLALIALLAVQLGIRSAEHPRPPEAEDLPPPPRPAALRLASFGEPEALARIAMLYLQAFDTAADHGTPYRALDYARLVGWLRAILALDPRSEYPLFSAARIYAEVPNDARSRMALEFVYEEFLADPDRRWPWLAHAALVAKHRLKDLSLALRYAAAIDRLTSAEDVPLWAKQMQIFILEDLNELEAAKVMLGGLLASGRIRDPAEARFLEQRLEGLRTRAGQGGKPLESPPLRGKSDSSVD
jgi:hypothetical protein